MGESHESGWERQGTLWSAGTFVGELSSLVGNLRSDSGTTHCAVTVLWRACCTAVPYCVQGHVLLVAGEYNPLQLLVLVRSAWPTLDYTICLFGMVVWHNIPYEILLCERG